MHVRRRGVSPLIVGRVAVIVRGVVVVVVVGMVMVRVIMSVMVVAALAVVVGRALGVEGAGHRARRAALAAHQFGGPGRHVEHLRGDLGGDVAAAELPGEAQEPGRVLGPHLQQRLGGGPDQNHTPILEPQAVAIRQGHRPVEGGREAQAALPRQGSGERLAGGMVEGDAVDDRVGAEGGLADEGGGAQHGILTTSDGSAEPGGPRSDGPGATPRHFSPRTESPQGTLAIARAFSRRNS